ncbi:MAG: metallophosphoesterase [Gammaproteobacteria bacterium]|nr:metallophosphoesterase [Gammaproteobacteria bacterium]
MARSDAKKTFMKRLKASFSDLSQCQEVDVKESFRLPDKKVKVRVDEYPFQMNIYDDEKTLHLYPERTLDGQSEKLTGSFLIFDPEHYFDDISGFYRLDDGDKLTLNSQDEQQRSFLNLPKAITGRQISITNQSGKLVFKSHAPKSRTCIAPLLKDKKINRITNWRLQKAKELRELYGGNIAPLESDKALALIKEVNLILEKDAHRPLDNAGRPGGMVKLPTGSVSYIVGDLHAKTDNLLVVLSQHGYLDALDRGNAFLIILGDAVHPEGDSPLDEMESSMLIMDLIFKLKARFPTQVFYIRGNHDSFAEEIAKGGIPQGLLWEKQLIKSRGEEYLHEMKRFYSQLPYLVLSDSFITCHAAAPTSSPTMEMIINIEENTKLVPQLLNNRLRRPNRPSGYTRGDVKKLRKCLGADAETPMVVGHTPMSTDDTIWENVDGIENHHILYSSDSHWVGVMTQIGSKLYPFRYPVEPMSNIINSLSDK